MPKNSITVANLARARAVGAPAKGADTPEIDFLAPVASRSTLQDGVYRQLREALMSGSFDPGQVLTIASLASTFQTSHMPVREALRRLAAENALVVVTNGSARVSLISLAQLDDLCLARAALEALAGKLAAKRCTVDDRKNFLNLALAHEDAAREYNIQRMLQTNRDFHFAVYATSGSPVLVQLIQTLWLRFGPYMRMLSAYIEPLIVSEEYAPSSHHKDLLDALNKMDSRAAAKAVKADIETTQALLRRLYHESLTTASKGA